MHVLCLAVPSAVPKCCCLIAVYSDKLNDDVDDDDEDDDKDRTCSSGDMLADRQRDRQTRSSQCSGPLSGRSNNGGVRTVALPLRYQ